MKERLGMIHAKKYGNEDIVNDLIDMPFNSLNPILIDVYNQKAQRVTPNKLLTAYENNLDFFGPSSFSQKELHAFKDNFYAILPEKFETLQLSPIGPFGTCAAITKLSQDMRLTTIKNSELISDSTTILALEASSRRKKYMKNDETRYKEVNLSTFHRILRMQHFDKTKGYMQHFDILSMLTAGKVKGKNNYVAEKIYEHIKIWINFIKKLNENGYFFKDILISFSHVELMETLLEYYKISRKEINDNSLVENFDFFDKYDIKIPKKITTIMEIDEILESFNKNLKNRIVKFEQLIMNKLKSEYPDILINYELTRKLGLGYFSGMCFHIYAKNSKEEEIQLIDGGEINWTKQLLSDNKELAVASSFGAELIQKKFKK